MHKQREKWKPWLWIALIVVAALALTGMIGLLAFSFGRYMAAQGTPSPTASAVPAQPWPTVRKATSTVAPTATSTLPPTGTPTATPRPTATPTWTPTPTPTPRVIITEVRLLGRLETVKYMASTIIDLERQPNTVWDKVLGTDKLLLLAEGEVVAGFDMARVTREDIVVEGNRVTITLPPPEIFYSKIDNQRTRVYERTTGLFRQPDPAIESEARQLAEQAMMDRALEGEILRQAEMSGRVQIEAFLRALGFNDIVIVIHK